MLTFARICNSSNVKWSNFRHRYEGDPWSLCQMCGVSERSRSLERHNAHRLRRHQGLSTVGFSSNQIFIEQHYNSYKVENSQIFRPSLLVTLKKVISWLICNCQETSRHSPSNHHLHYVPGKSNRNGEKLGKIFCKIFQNFSFTI